MKEKYEFELLLVAQNGHLGTAFNSYTEFPDGYINLEKEIATKLTDGERYKITIKIETDEEWNSNF